MTLSAFLSNKLTAPIAIVLAILSLAGNAALGLLYWSETRTTGTLTTENTRLAGDLRQCQSNGKVLEGAIAAQNDGVDAMAKDAALRAANAKLAQAQSELKAAKLDAHALDIANAPVPPSGTDHCTAASRLIHDTLAGEQTNGI